MSKAIYIGAGLDIKTIILCKDIKLWILVDSLPISEFGIDRQEGFSREWFIPELLDIIKKYNFIITECSKDKYYIFKNNMTNQTIKYHINCAIPEEYYKIENDISDWDTLVNIGHHPHKILLNNSSKNKELTFIGSSRTDYSNSSEDDPDCIVNLFYTPNNTIFKKFFMIKNKKLIKINNFEELK